MPQIAPQHTRVTLAEARVISASSFRVLGIVLMTTASTLTVDFREGAADGDIILSVRLPKDETIVIDIPFLADNGLYIDAEAATTIVTVFHGAPGA